VNMATAEEMRAIVAPAASQNMVFVVLHHPKQQAVQQAQLRAALPVRPFHLLFKAAPF